MGLVDGLDPEILVDEASPVVDGVNFGIGVGAGFRIPSGLALARLAAAASSLFTSSDCVP